MTTSEYPAALFSLEGRTAVVTGGSSGIGRAIAAALAGAGARTVLVARDLDRLEAAARAMRADGGDVAVPAADLGTRDAVREGAEAVVGAVGEPDIVVSAAGVNLRPPMADIDEWIWDATIRLNLDAPFLLGQRFGPGMAERGYGRLIAISSQSPSHGRRRRRGPRRASRATCSSPASCPPR